MERARAEAILLAQGWLAEVPRGVRAALLARARLVSFAAGAPVFHIGDEAGGIYGIAGGAFGVLAATEGRSARLCSVLRRGAWFGHGPAVARGRRALGFRAMEPSVALHVPLAALTALARQAEGAMSLALLAHANMSLAITTVSDLQVARADRRVAAALLRATGVARGIPPADPAGDRLTQAEIGEMANASRQAVNRALGRFARQGWIALGYQRIAVTDPRALDAFAAGGGEA